MPVVWRPCTNLTGRVASKSGACDFRTGRVILQQPVTHEDMQQLLTTGKTKLLDKFVSNKTRRTFKAFLVYDPKEGKVLFEFEPRAARAPAKKAAAKKTSA